MSMDVFQACVDGYSDRMFDMQLLAVHQGYWAGYFGASKKPKSLKQIIQSLLSDRNKAQNKHHVSDIDVNAFMQTEEAFNKKLKAMQK